MTVTPPSPLVWMIVICIVGTLAFGAIIARDERRKAELRNRLIKMPTLVLAWRIRDAGNAEVAIFSLDVQLADAPDWINIADAGNQNAIEREATALKLPLALRVA